MARVTGRSEDASKKATVSIPWSVQVRSELGQYSAKKRVKPIKTKRDFIDLMQGGGVDCAHLVDSDGPDSPMVASGWWSNVVPLLQPQYQGWAREEVVECEVQAAHFSLKHSQGAEMKRLRTEFYELTKDYNRKCGVSGDPFKRGYEANIQEALDGDREAKICAFADKVTAAVGVPPVAIVEGSFSTDMGVEAVKAGVKGSTFTPLKKKTT